MLMVPGSQSFYIVELTSPWVVLYLSPLCIYSFYELSSFLLPLSLHPVPLCFALPPQLCLFPLLCVLPLLFDVPRFHSACKADRDISNTELVEKERWHQKDWDSILRVRQGGQALGQDSQYSACPHPGHLWERV